MLLSTLIQAQNKSLFWEISGNGLTKSSYLYGTMHVNEKVSFHLSDSFFKNLLGSDIIANESNPETWGELDDLMKNNDYNFYTKFYNEFYLIPASKETIKTIFNNHNSKYFKNMLSGAEGEQADFQENTVLDMFIFQTGKKYKKRIAGLENAKESMLSILQSMDDNAKPKDENKTALMKILKNRNLTEVLKEYYREKDIVMLDSIYKLMFSKKTHDALIVNRNKIMTKSIDSIAKTGSLFSAVGAAHLGGNEGIIELLRQKGYNVKPIIDNFTEKGKNQKKSIEAYFPNPNFTPNSTKDKMLQLPLYKTTIEDNESLGSPDFTNGGAITIKRIPLNYFLKKNNKPYEAKSLDSLFFEKIAGEILEKKYFEQANYSGYDIKNITKTGNSQHSKFFITPLEIISVTMTGPANYVRQYENEVFENIKIKSFKNEWERIKPLKGGFETELPSFNFVFGNSAEKGTDINIQAYDNQEKSYYFLQEKTLNDTEILEDSEYEHKQIHYQFYLQQDQDSTAVNYNKTENSLTSSSIIGNRNMKLKTIISGNKYYLLGTVNASEANTNRFFKSFIISPFLYKSKTKVYTDSIANYKIEIPEKENESLFLKLNSNQYQSKNTFAATSRFQVFNSENAQKFNLRYYKYSKYEYNHSIDSIQNNLNKQFLNQHETDLDESFEEGDENFETPTSLLNPELFTKKGFSKSNWNKIITTKKDDYVFLSNTTTFNKEKNNYIITAVVSRPNATQAIKYKAIYKDNAYYILNTLVNKNYQNEDPLIEKTFGSFDLAENTKPKDNENKVLLFIEDAKNEKDTIRYSALNSVQNLEITKNDLDVVTQFLNSFHFKENETAALTALLEKIGQINDEKVVPFLENYYKKESVKTAVQVSILKSLAFQKSKEGYKKIIELMDYDLPIPDNQYETESLFYAFQNDSENSKELFPEIFQYYSIKEYHNPIIEFSNSLLEQKLISVKKIKAFKKMILTNTKLEYKRVASWNQKNRIKNDPTENMEEIAIFTDTSLALDDLINYTTLIYNYADDKAVKDILSKIKNLDLPEVNTELVRLGITHNNLTTTEITGFLNDPKTRFATVNLLYNQNKKDAVKLTDDEISQAAAINFQNLTQKDSISLLEKKIIKKDEHDISIYFYTIKRKNKELDSDQNQLYTIAFVNKNEKIDPLAYKVLSLKRISEEEDLEKKCNLIVSEFFNSEHLRATFGKEKEDDETILEEY